MQANAAEQEILLPLETVLISSVTISLPATSKFHLIRPVIQ